MMLRMPVSSTTGSTLQERLLVGQGSIFCLHEHAAVACIGSLAAVSKGARHWGRALGVRLR